MAHGIRAILFDKDGTLIDVNRTWIPLYKEMLANELGLRGEAVEKLMVEAGYDPVADKFLSGSVLAGGTTRQLVGVWWKGRTSSDHDAIARRIDRDYAPRARKYLSPLMPLAPILADLQAAGFVLGIGTNDSKLSATGQMASLGLTDTFSTIIGADSVATPKPSGDMIRAFAEHCGCSPSEIAMVGDNTHDLEEAKHGGAGLGIGVLTGNGGADDLTGLADHVVNSVSDLPSLFASL